MSEEYFPMSGNDNDAIGWLKDKSEDMPALKNAWLVLEKYYDRCCLELKELDTTNYPFNSEKERNKCYGFVSTILTNKSFVEEIGKQLNYSVEEIKRILENNDYSRDAQWVIAKTNRLYNMHLKLGHSARITYVASEGLKNVPEGENTEIIDRTVLLSALLHDVGRFYQAVHYNSLDDGEMKDSEKTIAEIEDGKIVNNLKVDHAIAGYYYSLASALELHELAKIDQYEDVLRFVTEAVAAVVVRYHQKNNSDIDYFDFKRPISLIQDPNLIGDINSFINDAYNNAVLMNYDIDSELNSDHKKFIQDFVNKIGTILSDKNIDFGVTEGFDTNNSFVNKLQSELGNEIKELLKGMHGMSSDEVSEKIVELVNKKIVQLTKEQMSVDEKEKYKNDIKESLKKLLNYDVAAAINDMFKDEDKRRKVDPGVHGLISTALALTMDADKIDILNQRAAGIYNVSYYLGSLSAFPTEGLNLREILNTQFHFNLPDEGFVLDDKVLNVVRSMCDNSISDDKKRQEYDTMKKMLGDSLGEFNIFDTLKYPPGTTITVYKDKLIINGVEYPGDELYKFFGEDFITYITENTNYTGNNFKDFKKKYHETLRITVDRKVFDENISGLSEDAKKDAYKHLLITDGLTERFKKEGVNRPGNIWINAVDNKDTDHLLRSNISGLIWQINQFLMVNIRRKSSLELVKRYDILGDIYKQYVDNDPMIASILKEYIDYAKAFIDYVIENAKDEVLDSSILEEMRDKVFNIQNINESSYHM